MLPACVARLYKDRPASNMKFGIWDRIETNCLNTSGSEFSALYMDPPICVSKEGILPIIEINLLNISGKDNKVLITCCQ